MSTIARLAGIAVAASLGLATPAFAHAHLKVSEPAAGSTVSSPDEIDLTFSEEVNLKFTGVTLAGPDGATVPLEDAMLMDDEKMLLVPVSGTLAPGVYTVAWHALSTDGHKTNGTYTFTVK